jgi:hypothetical protein
MLSEVVERMAAATWLSRSVQVSSEVVCRDLGVGVDERVRSSKDQGKGEPLLPGDIVFLARELWN